ncbi:B3 domain-containing protein REM5-like [Cryptomeria japonica]|uniref:B3 domain-containing protein REM5-like n=1 Tax=Cryptomeria japonica TaxID=3369 RepID=UPI0027DA707B|nr:B3 domain-containing protein REM5-like [Cryptomeria japonica]
MGPSGHLWHVKLCCTGASASFRDGWQDFVSDNHIKARDILVFRHVRDMYFVVQVFGAIQREHEQNDTLCDPKEEILSGICSQNKEIASADSSTPTSGAVPNVASCSFMRANSVLQTIPKDFGDRWLPNKKVELVFVHHKNPGEWRHVLGIYRGGRQYGIKWQRFVIDNKLHKGDKCVLKLINTVKHIFMIYVNKKIVSADSSTSAAGPNVASGSFMRDNSEAVAVLNPVKRAEPMFSVTLSKSATSNSFYLTIPKGFGDRWLPNKKVELIFVHHKNPGEWRHMLDIFRGGREYGVYWKSFVIDNKLHKGDNCVFKMINGVKHIFMIFVVNRVGE